MAQRLHQKHDRTGMYIDVSIAKLKGLDGVEVHNLFSRLKASPKCRAKRSLMRECREWFRLHKVHTDGRTAKASQYSTQTGQGEKLVIATV